MIQGILKNHIAAAFKSVYQIDVDNQQIVFENTKPDFEGDYTFVVFAYLKMSRKIQSKQLMILEVIYWKMLKRYNLLMLLKDF
jgi:hypothetical protein